MRRVRAVQDFNITLTKLFRNGCSGRWGSGEGVADGGVVDFFAAGRSLPGEGGARVLEDSVKVSDGNNSWVTSA